MTSKLLSPKKKIPNNTSNKLESKNVDSTKTDKDIFKSISSDLDNRFTFSNFIVENQTNWLLPRLEGYLNLRMYLLTPYFCMVVLDLAKRI